MEHYTDAPSSVVVSSQPYGSVNTKEKCYQMDKSGKMLDMGIIRGHSMTPYYTQADKADMARCKVNAI